MRFILSQRLPRAGVFLAGELTLLYPFDLRHVVEDLADLLRLCALTPKQQTTGKERGQSRMALR